MRLEIPLGSLGPDTNAVLDYVTFEPFRARSTYFSYGDITFRIDRVDTMTEDKLEAFASGVSSGLNPISLRETNTGE